jgi:hypothetical protein
MGPGAIAVIIFLLGVICLNTDPNRAQWQQQWRKQSPPSPPATTWGDRLILLLVFLPAIVALTGIL